MEALLRLMEQDRGFGIPPGAGLTGEQGAGIMRREISMKKAMVFLVMLGFAATLGAQSLAELARLEKARRNSLGDRKAPVITNLDLLRVMKKPAVEIVVPPSEIAELEEDMGAEEEVADESVEPAAKEPALRLLRLRWRRPRPVPRSKSSFRPRKSSRTSCRQRSPSLNKITASRKAWSRTTSSNDSSPRPWNGSAEPRPRQPGSGERSDYESRERRPLAGPGN
jgi:hypothetical protein